MRSRTSYLATDVKWFTTEPDRCICLLKISVSVISKLLPENLVDRLLIVYT